MIIEFNKLTPFSRIDIKCCLASNLIRYPYYNKVR